MAFTEQYDVVVVGAGHAGCEAAMAAARMGLKTALYTLNVDLIAQMSCNPAIGGIAKGHLVREVDALGGIMGEVTDAVGIQFRLLNTSRGPAVWSPRAQCDKQQYRVKMREVLESQPNLKIKQAEVAELIIEAAVEHQRSTFSQIDNADDSVPISELTDVPTTHRRTVLRHQAPRRPHRRQLAPSSSPPEHFSTASSTAASSSIPPDAAASRTPSCSARRSSNSACAAAA